MEETTIQPTVSPGSQPITITIGSNQPIATTAETSPPSPETQSESMPVEKSDKKINSLIPQVPYYSDPIFYEVANYFGLKQEDYDMAKNKLSDIVEYVIRDIESNDVEKIVPRLREIEDSIQSAGWDERRYANFHKYIRLADKKATIGKMMRAYEKGN